MGMASPAAAAAAVRVVGEPVRDARVRRAEAQGRGVRVPAGAAGRQERPPHRVQPRAQEDARAPPRRPPDLRVAGHRAVRRRGIPRAARHPPRRPVRPRRAPVLGGLRRRQAPDAAPDAAGDDRRRRGRRGGAGGRGARAARGGGLRGVRGQREALLRRRRRRVHGHRPRLVRRVAPRGGDGHRAAGPRRGGDAPACRVGGAVLRARGRQGRHARRRQARGVRRGAPRGVSEMRRRGLAGQRPRFVLPITTIPE